MEAADSDRRYLASDKISTLLSCAGRQKASCLVRIKYLLIWFEFFPWHLWEAWLGYQCWKTTLPTTLAVVSVMGMNFKPQTGLWKQCHRELMKRNWLKELIPSPHPVGLVGVSSSILAMATASPWGWTKTQEAYLMFREWMRGSDFCSSLGVGVPEAWWPCSSSACPGNTVLVSPWLCCSQLFTWSKCSAYLRLGSMGPGWVTNHIKALRKQKKGKAEADQCSVQV